MPPYAPEYNPDELLNSDLKRAISKRPSPRSDGELEHNVRSHLKSVQLKPGKIKGFFSSPTTRYAFWLAQGLFSGAIIKESLINVVPHVNMSAKERLMPQIL